MTAWIESRVVEYQDDYIHAATIDQTIMAAAKVAALTEMQRYLNVRDERTET